MFHSFLYFLAVCLLFVGCTSTDNSKSNSEVLDIRTPVKDSVLLRFAFVGCNRVNYDDFSHSDASTANVSALFNIFNKITELKNKPDMLFFLGDMVNGESDVPTLESELIAWLQHYNDTSKSRIKSSLSGIEMIAIPGNHEMLTYREAVPNEIPLEGATQAWMKHMSEFMPKKRDYITKDSINNQMTYAIKRGNIGFIVLNTDTYNTNDLEGQIPVDWVVKTIKNYRADPNIDHIFALGHRPFYINCNRETGHDGIPANATPIWDQLSTSKAVGMLSAHVHDYQRMQPNCKGPYQIIAGNGGSSCCGNTPQPPAFFGFTTIEVWSNGEIKLYSHGYAPGKNYYDAVPNPIWSIRDSAVLTQTKNKLPYKKSECGCAI